MYDWRHAANEIKRVEQGRGRRLTPQQRERVKQHHRYAQQATTPLVLHPLVELLDRIWFNYLGGDDAFDDFTKG